MGVAVALSGVAAGLFVAAYADVVHSAFRERSAAYVRAFAAAVEPWLARGDTAIAETLAQVFVSGSIRSVKVVAGGNVQILLGENLTTEPAGPGESVIARRGPAGDRFLDVVASLAEPEAYVRAAVDPQSADTAVRLAMVLTLVGALLFNAALFALLVWVVRGQRPAESAVPAPPVGETVVAGDLVIVPARREATFAGRRLRLTPKEYALLSLLAEAPGKVFTEGEILAAVWPDSAYADARDIKQYVYLLRGKLAGVHPRGRDIIANVPGFGYRLDDGR